MVDVLVGAAIVAVAVAWVRWDLRTKRALAPAPTASPPKPPSEDERFIAVLEASADLPWRATSENYCMCAGAPLMASREFGTWSVATATLGEVLKADAPARLTLVLDAARDARRREPPAIDAVEKRVREAVEAQARLALRKLGEGG